MEFPLGAFVEAKNDKKPKKSNILLTIDGIYLWSLKKIQVGHEIFGLQSDLVNTRWKVIESTVSKTIIQHVK